MGAVVIHRCFGGNVCAVDGIHSTNADFFVKLDVEFVRRRVLGTVGFPLKIFRNNENRL
jgi:hypothetical protein